MLDFWPGQTEYRAVKCAGDRLQLIMGGECHRFYCPFARRRKNVLAVTRTT